jgi:hypothetical protein
MEVPKLTSSECEPVVGGTLGSTLHPTDGGWYRRLSVPADPFFKRKHAISPCL